MSTLTERLMKRGTIPSDPRYILECKIREISHELASEMGMVVGDVEDVIGEILTDIQREVTTRSLENLETNLEIAVTCLSSIALGRISDTETIQQSALFTLETIKGNLERVHGNG